MPFHSRKSFSVMILRVQSSFPGKVEMPEIAAIDERFIGNRRLRRLGQKGHSYGVRVANHTPLRLAVPARQRSTSSPIARRASVAASGCTTKRSRLP